MFKHECNDDEILDNGMLDELSDVEEEIENIEDEVHDSVNGTFQNPSQVDDNTCEKLFDCRLCDYKGPTNVELVNHKKTFIIGALFVSLFMTARKN